MVEWVECERAPQVVPLEYSLFALGMGYVVQVVLQAWRYRRPLAYVCVLCRALLLLT